MESRPDIKVGVLNIAGTDITNNGLLTLKDRPIEELLLSSTRANCDEIADELSKFPIQDWDFGDRLSSKGLSRFSSNPHVRGLSLDSKVIGTQSLSLFVNSDLRRLQIYAHHNRPLPTADQFRRIPKLTDLYLPYWRQLVGGEKIEELRRALPHATVHVSNYYERLPPPSEYPETDMEIVSLVEAVGGNVMQYRRGSLTTLLAADNPSLSNSAINISIRDQPAFGDAELASLAELLKHRPDIGLTCFHIPGTSVTNDGLRCLKGLRIAQISLGQNVKGDEIADEASQFDIGDWCQVPGLTEVGLLTFLKTSSLKVINITPDMLTPSVIEQLSKSTVFQIRINGAADVELLSKLTTLSVLNLDPKVDVSQSYLDELHRELPHVEVRHRELVMTPTLAGIRAAYSAGRPLRSNEFAPVAADVPGSYSVGFVARRQTGNDALTIKFPVEDRIAVVVFGGSAFSGHRWSGIGFVNEAEFVEQSQIAGALLGIEGDPFKDGNDHLIQLTVARRSVTVSLDGNIIVDWEGDPVKLKPHTAPSEIDAVLFLSAHSNFFVSKLKYTAGTSATPEMTAE